MQMALKETVHRIKPHLSKPGFSVNSCKSAAAPCKLSSLGIMLWHRVAACLSKDKRMDILWSKE